MICTDPMSDCGIVSDSLTITGSGAPGNPYRLETNAFSVVTSVTRPASPFVGQFIWETDTQRQLVWTGADWLIVAGAFPAWNLVRAHSEMTSCPNTTTTAVPLPSEIEDSDGFHTGTTAVVTIPAGYGGDYQVSASITYADGGSGHRQTVITVAGNATTPLEHTSVASYVVSTNANTNVSKRVRLEAGATLTLNAYQSSGSALNIAGAWFTGTMVRHLPTLT